MSDHLIPLGGPLLDVATALHTATTTGPVAALFGPGDDVFLKGPTPFFGHKLRKWVDAHLTAAAAGDRLPAGERFTADDLAAARDYANRNMLPTDDLTEPPAAFMWARAAQQVELWSEARVTQDDPEARKAVRYWTGVRDAAEPAATAQIADVAAQANVLISLNTPTDPTPRKRALQWH